MKKHYSSYAEPEIAVRLLVLLSVFIMATSCGDIFEPDISRREMSVIAPANGVEIEEGEIAFRWNTLRDTEKYRVTIVSPSFENASRAVRDTVIFPDSLAMSAGFKLMLIPARYEWSVQGFNFAYESRKSIFGFTIIPKKDETPEPEPEDTEPESPETTE